MLTFNQLPPTAETTDVHTGLIHLAAYGAENRCINGAAEACATFVLAHTDDMAEVAAISEKAGREIAASEAFGSRAAADGRCFTDRFNLMAGIVIQNNSLAVEE